ncbi:MAG: hypothetical protein M0R06_06035 [Sphaerochaeta sp.]|nr:hypothetical protein [Sphaerochaeta sp.]
MAGNSMNQWSWSEILARYDKTMTTLRREVNVLVERHPILMDAPVREAESINGEEFDITTSLPQPYLLSRGEGRAATKGQVQHGSESMAWFGNQLRVNKEYMTSQPQPAAWLQNEEMKYLEGMNQAYAEMLFYGDSSTEPKEFDGLDVRYGAIADYSVFDNGASTASSLTDIWLIQWDQYDCCMIYPKGERGGIQRTPLPDAPLATQTDSDNAVPDEQKKIADFMRVNFDWKGGLCLKDPRRIKRITNIHTDNDDANAFDIRIFRQAKNAFAGKTFGTIYAYLHSDLFTQIENAVDEKVNIHYPPNQPFATPQAYIGQIPLRPDDRILLTNSQMT